MATVNLLVWNIQTLSENKYRAANGPYIINTVAQTSVLCNATIIGILEIIDTGTGRTIGNAIGDALSVAIPGSVWQCNTLVTKYNDVYAIIYRTDQGFEYMDGCTTNRNAAGQRLEFPSPSGRSSGRKPGAFLFRTNDRAAVPNVYFSVILYHAPGPQSTYRYLGIQNIPFLGPVTIFTDTFNAAVTYPVTASFIGGDFNVNALDPHMIGYYANAYALGQTSVPVALGNFAKSSLTNTSPLGGGGYPNTVDYRANAYDNIFARNPTITGPNHGVIDLINLFKAQPGVPLPALAICGAAFRAAAIIDGNMIRSNPLDNNEDAWHVYRYGLSDHLPVFGQYTV